MNVRFGSLTAALFTRWRGSYSPDNGHEGGRSGDPNIGNFGDATILKTFGEVPQSLDEL